MSKTSRMNAGLTTALVLGVALAAAVLINIISANVYGRLDLTANEINSLSEASRDAVAALDDLEVRVYISSDLPESVTDADTGREIILRDVTQNFRDKLEEYHSLSDGNMTLSYVREDVVDMAEAAKIRLFAGEEASTTKEGFLEFKQYALGASFHYKNAMEVLPKAFEPEFYEFEITKILVRLKEKVAKSLLMKDVLSAGESLDAAIALCTEAVRKAQPEEDTAARNPFGLMSAEAGKARLDAYMSAAASISASCENISNAMAEATPHEASHEPLDVVIATAKGFMEAYNAFQQSLAGDEEAQQSTIPIAEQLVQIGDAVTRAHDNLVDSPGRQEIGFICAARAFCPFPSGQPLIPRELEPVIGQQNPFAAQVVPQLQQMEQQVNQILQSVEQGLFKQNGYNVVSVNPDEAIPTSMGSLILFGPKDALSEYALYQLDQFVMGGGSLVVFLNHWDAQVYNMNAQGSMDVIQLTQNKSNVGELLAHWGITPLNDLVMEPESHDFLNVLMLIRQGQIAWRTQKRFGYPMLPMFAEFADNPLVRGMPSITLPFTSSLDISAVEGVEISRLIQTSADANTTTDPQFPLDPERQLQQVNAAKAEGVRTVAAMATGTLPSFFAGKEAPEAPTENEGEEPAEEESTKPTTEKRDSGSGRVLVIGSNLGLEDVSIASVFHGFSISDLTEGSVEVIDKFRGYGANMENWKIQLNQLGHTLNENLRFMFNALDWSTQNEALVAIRSKQYQRRPLKTLDADRQSQIKAVSIASGPIVFLIICLAGAMRRRSRRERITV